MGKSKLISLKMKKEETAIIFDDLIFKILAVLGMNNAPSTKKRNGRHNWHLLALSTSSAGEDISTELLVDKTLEACHSTKKKKMRKHKKNNNAPPLAVALIPLSTSSHDHDDNSKQQH